MCKSGIKIENQEGKWIRCIAPLVDFRSFRWVLCCEKGGCGGAGPLNANEDGKVRLQGSVWVCRVGRGPEQEHSRHKLQPISRCFVTRQLLEMIQSRTLRILK